MALRGDEKSFDPLEPVGCKALVLGTYPSPKSMAKDHYFYYGHPQNRFWPLVAALAGVAPPTSIAEKRALIMAGRLAVWDTLESCRIEGAKDHTIKDPKPTDVPGLVARHGIEAVFCNGAAAYELYGRFHLPHTGIEAVKLPSTSPANAAFTFEKLLAAWAPVRKYLIVDRQ